MPILYVVPFQEAQSRYAGIAHSRAVSSADVPTGMMEKMGIMVPNIMAFPRLVILRLNSVRDRTENMAGLRNSLKRKPGEIKRESTHIARVPGDEKRLKRNRKKYLM